MSLFSLPPAPPRADLNLDMFLKGSGGDEQLKNFRRTMPAEWFPQSGIQLTWPHRGTDWASMLEEVTACYLHLAYEIATREPLLIVTPQPDDVRRLLESRLPHRATDNISYAACDTNDTWARDHAFISVLATGQCDLLDFRFDGWGGKFEARLDNAINRTLFEAGVVTGNYLDELDFTLEGGSIESDGNGTLLTTAQCLLNPNRNASLTKAEIEQRLMKVLGVDRVLWLTNGHLTGDDTDAHIDTLARFCPDNTIAYACTDDESDEHFACLQAMADELRTFRTADGKPYRLVPLPLPAPIFDEDGNRLPATYANFLIMNTAVLYPTYGQPEADSAARQALSRIFQKTDLVGVDCRALTRQHGSLHCATMQYPKGVIRNPQTLETCSK